MGYANEPERAELFDLAWEMQDIALDMQHQWLQELSVTDEIKREIFEHMCVITGMLLDATLDPAKFNKLMGLE